MFGIMRSALFAFGGFLYKVVVVKGLVFAVILAFSSVALTKIIEELNKGAFGQVNSALGQIGSGALWVGGLLRLDVGLPLIFAASCTAFAIRRLPIVG